ncbi:MAG: hypothetical protein FWD34_08070 [Oscillospiraceae bacterium]|nr:hypothetical protein [Oscillospiraceae bacterium]
MRKYICPICGYIHEGENPPVFCPLCKCGGKKFERSSEVVAPKIAPVAVIGDEPSSIPETEPFFEPDPELPEPEPVIEPEAVLSEPESVLPEPEPVIEPEAVSEPEPVFEPEAVSEPEPAPEIKETPSSSATASVISDSAETGMFLIMSKAAHNAGYPEFAEAFMRIAMDKAEESAGSVGLLLKKYMK